MTTTNGSTPLSTIAPVGLTVNVWSDRGFGADFAEMATLLGEMEATGYSHVELGARGLGVVIGGRVQPARLGVLQEALEGTSLRRTLHSSWSDDGHTGNLLDARTRTAQTDLLMADVDVAAAIGAEVLVYHAGITPSLYDDADALEAAMGHEREALRVLADRAAEDGVVVAVENRAPTTAVLGRRSYGMRPDLVAEQVAAVDHPHVTMCYDVGHAYLAARYQGFDFLEATRIAAPVIGHIHFCDNFGRMSPVPRADAYAREMLGEGDLHLPPGWGSIPLEDVLAIGYPRDPVVIVEMRHLEHHAEAFDTTCRLLHSADARARR